MKKKPIIFIIVLLLLGVGIYYAYSEYNRKPLTAAEKPSDFSLTAVDLAQEFIADEVAASKKYNDKVLEVEGIVASVNANGKVFDVVLETDDIMTMVNVNMIPEMNEKAQQLKNGDKVILKGICTGIASDVELNKGIIK